MYCGWGLNDKIEAIADPESCPFPGVEGALKEALGGETRVVVDLLLLS